MRERLDVDDLVQRAKIGKVTNEEVGRIVAVLKGETSVDVYRLLYVLVRVSAREYEFLVARFINYPADPQVAALALSSLCVQWKLAHRYRHSILLALGGVEWDLFDELKQAAIAAAGEYLRSAKDPLVLDRLTNIATSCESELNRRFAVEALARALGESYSEAVFPRDVGEGCVWAQAILDRAKRRLIAEHRDG